MQYIVCPGCGFMNDTVDAICVKCGNPLQRQVDSAASPTSSPQGSVKAQGADTFRIASTFAEDTVNSFARMATPCGDYPWGGRFINFLRGTARIQFVINLILLSIGVLMILAAGFSGIGGFGAHMISGFAALLLAVVSAALGFLFIWLNYMFMMALPDYLACLLQIERNTRTN